MRCKSEKKSTLNSGFRIEECHKKINALEERDGKKIHLALQRATFNLLVTST